MSRRIPFRSLQHIIAPRGRVDKSRELFSVRVKTFWAIQDAPQIFTFMKKVTHETDGLIITPLCPVCVGGGFSAGSISMVVLFFSSLTVCFFCWNQTVFVRTESHYSSHYFCCVARFMWMFSTIELDNLTIYIPNFLWLRSQCIALTSSHARAHAPDRHIILGDTISSLSGSQRSLTAWISS